MIIKKTMIYLFIISVLFSMCNKQEDNLKDDFLLLDGNNFILKIDRILNTSGQLPSHELQEDDFVPTNEDIQYDVTFSEDGQKITIAPGAVSGILINAGEDSRFYELNTGLFAGGGFLIWLKKSGFEAEYTIFGSGVPIISSFRGNLDLVE